MSENTQDTESLLDEGMYQQILRADSFLGRMDSNNFASLIETPSHNAIEGTVLRDQQHQQQQQIQEHLPRQTSYPLHHSSQEAPDFNTVINTALSLENSLPPSHELTLMGQSDLWDSMEDVDELLPGPSDAKSTTVSTTSLIPADSTPSSHVPSLQVWPGEYDFSISLPVGNKDRNKWCFSTVQNKLYMCDLITVPIEVKLLEWIDASITITPVFKDSRHRVDPVIPCYNCKSQLKTDSDHIVVVEGQDCVYKQINDRHMVTVPVYPPPPGEKFSTLLIKLTCRTSCVGGPNRRPFCLVFTLHDRSGGVIGRQVLDLKCCKCPSRDMGNEEKTLLNRQQTPQPALPSPNQTVAPQNVNPAIDYVPNEALKRSGPVTTTKDRKKKRFIVKVEPDVGIRTRPLYVQEHLYGKVQALYNALLAEEIINRTHPGLLQYSDQEV